MHKTFLILAFLGSTLILAAYAQQEVSKKKALSLLPGGIGAFQLLSGPGSSGQGTLLYRIDTRTGKTWRFLATVSAEGMTEPSVWSEIQEGPRLDPIKWRVE